MKSGMKGLLRKDILNLSHYKMSLLVSIIIVIGFGFSQESFYSIIPIMFITMVGMIALSTFSYDEIAKSDKFILSLPTDKKQMVQSKYILAIFLTIVGAVISVIISYLLTLFIHKQVLGIQDILFSTIAGFLGITIIQSIQIPSIYKWGAEKGRIQMFILVILVMAMLGGALYLLMQTGILMEMNHIFPFLEQYGVFLLLALIIVCYFVSYKISYHIYEKKEI